MKVCDICKNPSSYRTYVTTSPIGDGRTMDLCGKCYKSLREKEYRHRYLAYQEVVEETTGQKAQEKKTWTNIFRRNKHE